MKRDVMQQAEYYSLKKHRQKRWQKVVTCLAVIVVFCTTYALILPAITMEKKCNITEHTHSRSCYTKVLLPDIKVPDCNAEKLNIHKHTEKCKNEDGEQICGIADFVIHIHDELCYDEDGNLWCELPEIEEHTHNESCYDADGNLICDKEEIILHEHNEDCYDADGNLICDKIQIFAHQHNDDCFIVNENEENNKLTCGKEEGEGAHAHDESCFDENNEFICEIEANPGHEHTELCYGTWELTCEFEEHVHSDECLKKKSEDEQTTDSDDAEDNADDVKDNTGDDAPLSEDNAEIQSTDKNAGSDEAQNVQQTDKTENSKDEETSEQAEDTSKTEKEPVYDEIKTLTFEGEDYLITVKYGKDAGLPDGVKLKAKEILKGSDEYDAYYNQAADNQEDGKAVTFARFFDISFTFDGVKYEPEAPVDVTITYPEELGTGDDADCSAIHFTDDGTEILDVTAEEKDGSTSFNHKQNSFSVVGDIVARSIGTNPADSAPDRLTVNYYVCIDNEWVCVGSTQTLWYNNYDGTGTEWTNTNRDYISVEQAVSILGPYGFTGNEADPAIKLAYQQMTNNASIYNDTNSYIVNGHKVIPLSRNKVGYNVYYLPEVTATFGGHANLDEYKSANGFYNVKVFDSNGAALKEQLLKKGENFSYNAASSGVTSWNAHYGSGRNETITGSTISFTSVSDTITVSPKSSSDITNKEIAFKVLVDGEWQTVGTNPYYYTGQIGSETRAYITSDIAARFFGPFGYTATENPGKHFAYSYNDINEIYYRDTNYCLDVLGGQIQNTQAIQLYSSNHSNAQVFRIWDAEDGNHFITPIANSSLFVNVNGGAKKAATIHLYNVGYGDRSSQWKLVKEGGYTKFVASGDNTLVIDLDGGNTENGRKIQLWTDSESGAKYWNLKQVYRISTSTLYTQNADNTWKIGLTQESNGKIVCYYMPAETTKTYSDVGEDELSKDNVFYSVKVVDSSMSVYKPDEQKAMTQYVRKNGSATVLVDNANGIFWSCRSTDGSSVNVNEEQLTNGQTRFVISNITKAIEIVATMTDPRFVVQYYANVPTLATSGGNKQLAVIDTSKAKNGGSIKMPTNGATPTYRQIQLEGDGSITNKNRGSATTRYKLKTNSTYTKMYSEGYYLYESAPDLYYFDKLKENDNYSVAKIGVLKPGKSPTTTNENDFTWYNYNSNVSFTNVASDADSSTILIENCSVIRILYNLTSSEYYNDTTFYDYNISSGQNSDGRWRTGITGINIESNYGTSINGNTNWRSYANIIAFGNANCGTGMAGYMFDSGELNKSNSRNRANAYGCTFGLVQSLSDGKLKYNNWIIAPKLFNDGGASYKQTYSNSSLVFKRVGDNYTLSRAVLKNSNGQQNSINDLEYFFHPSPTTSIIYDGVNNSFGANILTNDFWPMDQAAGRTDALWGDYYSPGSFAGFQDSNNGSWAGLNSDFPKGDDGWAHNWFFGMNFSISFTLTSDYEGPMEYFFYGDDDMWVFLDNMLICDIGGVHSAVGEYVDLRDYLPIGSSGQHTLSFFYTERGASGSTCYMNFNLPSVTSAATAQDTGKLQLTKSINTSAGEYYKDEEYKFNVELLTSENGTALNQKFSFSREKDGSTTYGSIRSGGAITIKPGEIITISGIPTGTYYRVTEDEASRNGYQTTANNTQGYIVSGNIETDKIKFASYINTPQCELPTTGGVGTIQYTIGGALIIIISGAFLVYRFFMRRKGEAALS